MSLYHIYQLEGYSERPLDIIGEKQWDITQLRAHFSQVILKLSQYMTEMYEQIVVVFTPL